MGDREAYDERWLSHAEGKCGSYVWTDSTGPWQLDSDGAGVPFFCSTGDPNRDARRLILTAMASCGYPCSADPYTTSEHELGGLEFGAHTWQA